MKPDRVLFRILYNPYLFASATVLGVLVIRSLLNPLLDDLPFLLFAIGVTLSAWRGGLGPGIFATALSTTFVTSFIMSPSRQETPRPLELLVALGLFIGESLILTTICTQLRRTKQDMTVAWAAERAARRHADQALALLDTIVAAAPVGIAFLDDQLRYMRINAVLASLNGAPIEHHLGRTVGEVIPELQPILEPCLRQVLETGQPFLNMEIQGNQLRADGMPGYWIANYYPVRVTQGQLYGIGVIVTDISERKRRELVLQRAKDDLEALVIQRTAHLDTANQQLQQELHERKQTEVALQVSESRFRHLIMHAPIGILLQGPAAEILLCNPAALYLLDLSEDQLLGRTSLDASWHVIREDGSPFSGDTHPVPQAIATRQAVRNVVMGVFRPNLGDRVWLLVHAIPELDFDGTVRQVLCTFSDITERKQIEEALRESEARFQQLIRAVDSAFWLVTADKQTVIYASPAYEQIVQRPLAQLYNDPADFMHAVHPDDRGHVLAALQTQAEGGYDDEYRLIWPDGSIRWVRSRAFPLRDAQGNIYRIAGMTEDITARKEIQERLRVRERELQILFDILPVGVSITDERQQVMTMNRALEQMLALSPGAMGAEALRKRTYIHADGSVFDPESFPSALALRQQREVRNVEIGIIAEDGRTIWTSVSAAPLPIDGLGAVIVTVDITARKEYEQQLARYQEVLEQRNTDLRLQATTDSLTGLANRGAFDDQLAVELQRYIARAHSAPLSLLMIDIDGFKPYNDTFGHPAGDTVLKTVGWLLREHARSSDFVARFGGEEFAIILADTDESEALAVAERLRIAIATAPWTRRPVTISIGLASTGDSITTVEQLIAAADAALYRAKQSGRNRVQGRLHR